MRAVCVLPPGRDEPLWPEARGWEPTITSLEDVLALAGPSRDQVPGRREALEDPLRVVRRCGARLRA